MSISLALESRQYHSIEQHHRHQSTSLQTSSIIKEYDSSSEGDIISRPNDLDIICGSGKVISTHPGNRRFRAIVNKHFSSYAKSTSKRAKMEVTHDVMADIMESGYTRFLKKDPIYPKYYVAASRVGKDKVAQCLRGIMKAAQAEHNRKKQSSLRDQGNYSSNSHKKSILGAAEELKLFCQQGSPSCFDAYSALQQQLFMNNVLYGSIKATTAPNGIVNDNTNASHPTNKQFNSEHLTGASSSSHTAVLAPVWQAVPSEATSRWWLEDGPPLSCEPAYCHQEPPTEPSHNLQAAVPASADLTDSGETYSNCFCWEQRQGQEQEVIEQHHQEQDRDEEMAALDQLFHKSLFDPVASIFNVLQQEQQHLVHEHGDDIFFHSILDTLQRSGHQERENASTDITFTAGADDELRPAVPV